jgi:hypothetical protein
MIRTLPNFTDAERRSVEDAVTANVARANEVMAKLFTEVMHNFERRTLIKHATGVSDLLHVIADLIHVDLRDVTYARISGVGMLTIDMALGRDVSATTIAANANMYMAYLTHTATLPLHRELLARDLGRISAMLGRFVEVIGGDFWFAFPARVEKKAVNA